MLVKKIKYTDYNGEEREEEFYFNLSKAELTEWELGVDGGLTTLLQKMVNEKNVPRLAEYFKKLILKSYGEKSADGKRFIKSDELSTAFSQTEAYSNLYMEFFSEGGPEKAIAFVRGILPSDIDIDAASASINNIAR